MSRKYSDNELVTRAYQATFRAVETETEKGIIEGTPIVFNSDARIMDWCGEFIERIEPTAMKNTDMKDVRLFINHDTDKIALARSKNGNENSTMSFTIDEEGVHMRAKLDIENNQEARALYSAIQRGDMDGMSFMFRVKEDKWLGIDQDIPTRIVKDISIVHEVSVVNFPAYPQTSVSARGNNNKYSALEEARAHAKESALFELEKLKNENLINLME